MRRLVVACAATGVIAIAGLGMQPSPAQAQDAASAAQADAAGIAIKALGEGTYPDVYAEVVVDEPVGRVRLDVTTPGTATDALLQAAGGVPVDVRVVGNSHTELMQTQAAVEADEAFWVAQGVELNRIGPGAETNLVEIGVNSADPAVVAGFAARYGPDRVLVLEEGGSEPASRSADTSAYNGGLVLTSSTSLCTGGFGVHAGSAPRASSTTMILAGHCFPNGTVVKHNGVSVGTVSRSASVYKNNGMDIETASISSSRLLWETNTTKARSDGSVTSLPAGVSVCHSGAATDKKCGTTYAVNQAISQDGLIFEHLTFVKSSSSSSVLAAEGDSGGPWFTANSISGTRYFSAVGVLSGGLTGYAVPNCTTQLGSNQKCWWRATYTEFMPIFSTLNLWPNY